MPKKQKFPHLLGSKWTAQETTFGWRHFRVVNRKNEGKWVFAELVSACDASVRFWLNARQLRDRALWQAGWQPLNKTQANVLQTDDLHDALQTDTLQANVLQADVLQVDALQRDDRPANNDPGAAAIGGTD